MDPSALRERLKHFLDEQGRLKQYPSKLGPKMLALCYLAKKFEPGRRYTEREVNALLREWHTFQDWALLRRELYDRRFLNRDRNGSRYWLEEAQPAPEAGHAQQPQSCFPQMRRD